MKAIARRVSALETEMIPQGGFDWRKKTHLIKIDEGGDDVEALRRYRDENPDEEIAPDHNVIWLCFVSPKFDAEGNRILRKPKDDYETAKRQTRKLDVLLPLLEGDQ